MERSDDDGACADGITQNAQWATALDPLEDGTRALRLLWCDFAGVRRCRVVPKGCITDALTKGVGLTRACVALPVYGDVVAAGSGLSATGEVRLTPADSGSSIHPLPWCPGHALALCNLLERSGAPAPCCPRSALHRALQQLQQHQQLRLLVGFELEFILLQPQQPGIAAAPAGEVRLKPTDTSVYCQSASFDAHAEVLDAMVDTLDKMGIGVLQYHAESAFGQFEIATAPAPALEAADKLLLAKEAITAVARRHQLAVTFAPKPLANQGGNGCHCHISLWRDGVSVMAGTEPATNPDEPLVLSSTADAFLGGVLSHLPGLLPFTTPSTNSYERIRPGCWSGAYAVWGWDNREAPLRLTTPGGPESTNAEIKAFDHSANPYVALAAVVHAGVLGLQANLRLPPPVAGDPAEAPGSSLLPFSLGDALAALDQDEALKGALSAGLGPELLTAFLAVRQAEASVQPPLADVWMRY